MKKWENSSLDGGSSAIVCRRLHMALLSYYFHHGSSSFDAMCGAFAHTNSNANPSEPQSLNIEREWPNKLSKKTLLCSLYTGVAWS